MTDRKLEELTVGLEHDGWQAILEEIAESAHKPQIIPVDAEKAKDSLVKLQMTTQSYLGASVFNTGGMIFGNGLVRLYGSGSDQIPDISTVNQLTTLDDYPAALVVGYDVFGGIFALDGGGLGIETGSMCFLPVDTLEWGSMGSPYSYFLSWLIDGSRIEGFYENLLWNGWREQLAELREGYGFSLFPPPSTTAWRNVASRSAAPVPLSELLGELAP